MVLRETLSYGELNIDLEPKILYNCINVHLKDPCQSDFPLYVPLASFSRILLLTGNLIFLISVAIESILSYFDQNNS